MIGARKLNHRAIAARLAQGVPMSVVAKRFKTTLSSIRWIATKYRIKPARLRRPWTADEVQGVQEAIEFLARSLNRSTGAILSQAVKLFGGREEL